MQESRIWSLGWEDPLKWEMATSTGSSILAQKTPWTEEPGRPQSKGSQRVGHDWAPMHTGYTCGGRRRAVPQVGLWGLGKQHPPNLEGEEGRQDGLGGGCNGKGYWHGLQRRKRTSPSARSAQSRERKWDEKRPRGKGLKTPGVGTFLVVQWLRVLFPMQGAWVRSLARELDLTCHN